MKTLKKKTCLFISSDIWKADDVAPTTYRKLAEGRALMSVVW